MVLGLGIKLGVSFIIFRMLFRERILSRCFQIQKNNFEKAKLQKVKRKKNVVIGSSEPTILLTFFYLLVISMCSNKAVLYS